MNRLFQTSAAMLLSILSGGAAASSATVKSVPSTSVSVSTPPHIQSTKPAPASKLPSKRRQKAQRLRPAPSAVHQVAKANAAATEEPALKGFINAMQVYPYSDGVLYRLYAAPERVTDISLQQGEAIISVAAGDTVRWTVGDTTSGTGETRRVHILVKPFSAGLSTNLVITTDRRSYHLQLESNAKTAMAALSWTYPQDALIAIQRAAAEMRAATPVASGLAVEALRFDYKITGDKPSWRPLRAFDDGRQTFIEFPADIVTGEAPPLFIVGTNGEAELVNYRMSGRYYVVDRLFDIAELRLGAKRQAIVRISRNTDPRKTHGSAL